jgi:hypothetical protein
MPIGVIVVDHELRLLSGNPYARIHFAYQDNMNTLLTDHLYFGKQHPHTVLNRLAKSMAEKACVWQLDNGSHIDGFLSVRTMGKTTSEPETYLIFLRTADHD